ncbi:DUF2199 domain-containing protein [Bradyrhizobium sp. 26S5]|uniref:DUF2199 domain-containing protein n=1 Tax=unclassified Bradyrhizobium TaxID=2631580 RepID=UPI00140D8534|nr:DUF2199 domain-containing protein [Bradyrhizobium sp. 2S1]MCK7668952.1 DUF2199 domain-containing protein [Bradyrhizobium sp. 2S1]
MPDLDLSNDPRWRRLWERPWRCNSCGDEHHGIFDLACGKPAQFPGPEELAPNSALDLDGDFLSEDFCVLEGEHFFVRSVLELPIIGSDNKRFGFGVWTTLSRENFERYVASFDSGGQDGMGPWFGWFSNCLQGYPETLNLKCRVHLKSGRQRPKIELEPTEHPLAVEQRLGVTFDRVLEIYAINGHDIRRSLTD